MGRHSDAQNVIIEAFSSLFGHPPTLNERIFAGSVALGESGYGQGQYENKLTGEKKVLNNWGAVQCGHGPPCGAGCWEATDFHVKNGVRTPYQWCYQDNSGMSRVDAAIKFLKTLYQSRPKLLAAASNYPTDSQIAELLAGTGDNAIQENQPLYDGKGTAVNLSDHYHVAWFSKVQRDSGYFELPLREHIGAQLRYHAAIKAETGEDIVDGGTPGGNPKSSPGGSPSAVPVYFLALSSTPGARDVGSIHEGMKNNATVRVVQAFLKSIMFYKGSIDGDFGPLTAAAIKTFLQ